MEIFKVKVIQLYYINTIELLFIGIAYVCMGSTVIPSISQLMLFCLSYTQKTCACAAAATTAATVSSNRSCVSNSSCCSWAVTCFMMLLSRLSYIHVLLPGCAVSNNIPRGHKYWCYFLIIDCLNDFQREEVIQLDQEQSLLHIY